jgi:hypothetical protein
MQIIETTLLPEDKKLVIRNKKRGAKMLIIFSIVFFGSSYIFKEISIALVFLPFFFLLLYAIFKGINGQKTISIGYVTDKKTEYYNNDRDGMPHYYIRLDNEKDFDLFGIPYELYWEEISIGQKIEIHQSNGSIIKINIV